MANVKHRKKPTVNKTCTYEKKQFKQQNNLCEHEIFLRNVPRIFEEVTRKWRAM